MMKWPQAAIFIHQRHCQAIVQNSIDELVSRRTNEFSQAFLLDFHKLFDSWTYFAEHTWQVLDMQNNLTNNAGGFYK